MARSRATSSTTWRVPRAVGSASCEVQASAIPAAMHALPLSERVNVRPCRRQDTLAPARPSRRYARVAQAMLRAQMSLSDATGSVDGRRLAQPPPQEASFAVGIGQAQRFAVVHSGFIGPVEATK